MKTVHERDIERYLVHHVRHAGGEVRKVQWIGRRGAPDRVVMLPEQTIVFVELKAPGKKAYPHQVREHARMARMGVSVLVIDSFEQIDRLIGE